MQIYSVYQNNLNTNVACNDAKHFCQMQLVFTSLLSLSVYLSNEILYASLSWKIKEYCFDKKVCEFSGKGNWAFFSL